MKDNVAELIRRAQGGEEFAFSRLKEIYRPLIDASAYRFASDTMTEQDREDIHQEAIVYFCDAVCSFNTENEGIEFGLYAKICVEHGLVSFIRLYNRQNRLRSVSLDESSDTIDDAGADFLQSIVDRERMSFLIRQINKQLSEFEGKVWWMYVSGMSVSSIAESIGVNNKSVSNAIYRIRRKLKSALLMQK